MAAGREFRRCWVLQVGHQPAGSHASTLSGFSSTHWAAASSGDMPSSEIYFATVFWSSLVHSKFWTSSTPGPPSSTQEVEAIFLRVVSG